MKKTETEDAKYAGILKKYKFLRVADIKKLKEGQQLQLGVYNHAFKKFSAFSFIFQQYEIPKGSQGKRYAYFILGKSAFLSNLPMTVCKPAMETRIVISSDISPVFLVEIKKVTNKATRPSPSASATLFPVGTKKKGQDGKMWNIIVTKNKTKRWARV